jgi:hypothetical protein
LEAYRARIPQAAFSELLLGALTQTRLSEAEFSNFYFADTTSLIAVSSGAFFSACFLASVRRSLILSPRLA